MSRDNSVNILYSLRIFFYFGHVFDDVMIKEKEENEMGQWCLTISGKEHGSIY